MKFVVLVESHFEVGLVVIVVVLFVGLFSFSFASYSFHSYFFFVYRCLPDLFFFGIVGGVL